MAVNVPELAPPLPVPGFRVGTASCGVKSPKLIGKRDDLMLLLGEVPLEAAGVFTRNQLRAACVQIAESTLAASASGLRAVVANSGNANAATGPLGQQLAQEFIAAGADAAGCSAMQVLSASTGVIGQPLPVDRIMAGMPQAVASASADNWIAAAKAIATTDTFPKWSSCTVALSGRNHTITGIAKGSGMIHPNMATMLGFVATDAPLAAADLQAMLTRATARSFNSISVDGDSSTNDTCYLLASGLGLGLPPLTADDAALFETALTDLCIELAQLIVRDGEGVSKFVTIEVNGARSEDEARTIGRAIAISPLVKTAFAGSDANWGRILSAIGNSGVPIDPGSITLHADEVLILERGGLCPDYKDEDGMAVFAQPEFELHVDLGLGAASATVWTGDLTHDYIKINAEYRT